MLPRLYWTRRIEDARSLRPIVWLAGVRRSGKTTLARMLPDSVYLNCDLPSTVRRLADPESFLGSIPPESTLVLDEVHRLPDPTRLLKIAADMSPPRHVLATGSSTLSASRKFRDTLTGRKTTIQLTPVLWTETEAGFGPRDLDRRLRHGGLPELLLDESPAQEFYAEWLDSFYARDIQELFGIRERTGFLDLLKLMLRQSGGMVDYSALAREVDLARPTVKAHLEAMTVACALYPVRPFHGRSRREIVRRPRVYGFDTGFVCFVRGWSELRNEDRGPLWEHLVLDVLRAARGTREICYWRDKSDREIDFVVPDGQAVHAIECKINPERVEPHVFGRFRELYAEGTNYVVSPAVSESYRMRHGGLVLNVVGCAGLLESFSAMGGRVASITRKPGSRRRT